MSLGTKILLSLLLLAVGAYAGFSAYRIWEKAQTSEYDPKRSLNYQPRSLGEYEFTERSGKKVRLTDLSGKVVVVNFFFATCPFSCRNFSATVAKLSKDFAADDVQFVSITVDPIKDTPERLQEYANQFEADAERWWFLNAPLRDTQELGRALKVTVLGADHTDELIVIDRNGVVRGAYDHKVPKKLEQFSTDLQTVLDEPPLPKATATPTATATPMAK